MKTLELGITAERSELSINNRLQDWWGEVKDYFWEDTRGAVRSMIKLLLEECLEVEISKNIGADYYERSPFRIDKRNGYYMRGLSTEMGYIEQIRVPRPRAGGFQFLVIKKYKRRQESVNKLLMETFLAGVSTRRVGEVLEEVLTDKPSSSTISRVTKILDREVKKYHSRRLCDEYIYAIFDGVCVGVKDALKANKRSVLAAYGIKVNGERELIDFRQSSSESEAKWAALLNDLYERGLKGENLKLITIDGGKGLNAALDIVYPFVDRQLCWVHKLRNVSKRIPKKHREQCMKEAKQIYLAKNRKSAVRIFKKWKKKWGKLVPEAVKCLEKDIDALLSFFDCPENHRIKVRTTNIIERVFVEVRRRTRPMSCFTNRASCDRIIYAVFSYLNTKWRGRPIKGFKEKDTV